MSYRALFVQTYIVGAALFGSVLVSATAQAQAPGCCEGGSATGANAWTAGNNWNGWGEAAAPIFSPSSSWPAEVERPDGSATAPWVIPWLATVVPDDAPWLAAGAKDEPAPSWWTHGEIEIGGRDFTNNPTVGGAIYGNTVTGTVPTQTANYVHLGENSLAKYYEYSIIAPGAFGGGHVATGSSDGLYQLDLWANNVGSNFAGFSDQSYLLQASKAGEQYFSFAWDETPHVYSTSAQTPFLGVGTNNLTVPSALLTKPLVTTGNVYGSGGPTGAGIVPYLYNIDLGIQRDTASFAYRWTPTDAWDFNADYSHMDRTGTQAAGIVELEGFQPTQVPAPVDDSTQNFGVNGEYLGKNLWGQYTFKAGYSGSIYTDNISNYTVQNPFFPVAGTTPAQTTGPTAGITGNCLAPAGTTKGTANCGFAQLATPPSNDANSVTATATADLPLKSRYVGTVSFTQMDQNAAFIPMTDNPLAANAPNGQPWYSTAALPQQSLNGQIDTLLSNNTITTQITPELTSKLSYRYYDFDNGTPRITFPCWVSYDGTGVTPYKVTSGATAGDVSCGSENTIQSLSISYVKQNAGAELNWRPDNEWNFNAAYGYERYDYQETDANATNENSAKLSGDWRPASWFDTRLTGYYSDRTYEIYNYNEFVVANQFPTVTTTQFPATGLASGLNYTPNTSFEYSPAYQQFMYDNRLQTKVDLVTNIVVLPGVTISPSLKYQDDHYGVNPIFQEGINDNTSIGAGVDLVYVPKPDLSFAFSYYWEDYTTLLYSNSGTGLPTPSTTVATNDKEYVNTFVGAVNYAAIPGRLNFDLRASVSDGVDKQACTGCSPAFPDVTTLDERVDATATYKLDPALVGFADMKVKLRYSWERNAVANWANDPLAPWTSSVGTNALYMAYDNPNFNVQMVSASLIVKW